MYNYPISPRVGISTIIFRTLGGIIGGLFGTGIIFIGILITGYVSVNANVTEDVSKPFSVFLVVALAFLGLLVADLITATFLTYLNREKYQRLFSTLVQIFTINVIITMFSFPLYLMVSAINANYVIAVAAVQLILSVQMTIIIMETIAKSKHIILYLYASAVAIMMAILIGASVGFSLNNPLLMSLIALPLIWGSFAFWHSSCEVMYQWFYNLYGEDFLSNETSFGEDYGKTQDDSDSFDESDDSQE